MQLPVVFEPPERVRVQFKLQALVVKRTIRLELPNLWRHTNAQRFGIYGQCSFVK